MVGSLVIRSIPGAGAQKGLSLDRHNCPLTPQLELAYNELTGDVFPDSLATCSNALRTIKCQVQKISDQSFEQREQEHDILIEQLDQPPLTSDHSKRAAILRKICHSEKPRVLALKLKSVRTTQASVGMSRIEIPVHPEHDPKTCTEWQLIDLPSGFCITFNSGIGNTSGKPSVRH
jgi:hypothetical protein